MKTVVAYVTPELSSAMRHLAIDENTTVQELCNEAFRMLLKERGIKFKDSSEKKVTKRA